MEIEVKLDNEHWYEHAPELVETSQMVSYLYYVIKRCKLTESIIREEEHMSLLTDVAISGDRNVMKIETKTIVQCEDLTIEIQHMWNVKTKVIPVITGATGNI
jgi:hypothetical protein